MKNKNRELAAELAVGALVALIFAGLAVFTIAISGKNLFRKNVFQIETVMPDAMGLRPNDPVIAKGTTVGSVTKVFYDRDGVHVQAQLEAPVEFHEGYEVTVVSTSILGGRQLVLREGDETAPVVEDVRHLVGKKPSDLMEDATEAVARVREFLETDALTNLYTFSESLKVLGLRLENGEGTLGRLLSSDDEMYTNLNAAIANIKLISDRLEKGEGTLGRLLSSDDEMYTNLNAAVANIKLISDRLEKGEGTLGRLLSSDDEMYTNLNAAVANIKLISDRLEKGEGTLGKLLSSDDELYRNVNGTVTDARELLDDMREANTLSTFTSLLLSGF
ncbi:MAG: MCE family protein [Kiritimatiellae bacterium]|nr:MCE family protein [Kiritimatiellia bacterium]